MPVKFRVVIDPRIGVRLMSGPLDYVAAQIEARRFAQYAPQVLIDRPVLRDAQRHAPITVSVRCRCGHPGCQGIGQLSGWVYPEAQPAPRPVDQSLASQVVRALVSDEAAMSPLERAVRRRPMSQMMRLFAGVLETLRDILRRIP